MKTIKIKVTQKDITDGQRRSIDFCPVALALQRSGFRYARVGVAIYCAGIGRVKIPSVSKFVERFDRGKPVRPFAFTLKIP